MPVLFVISGCKMSDLAGLDQFREKAFPFEMKLRGFFTPSAAQTWQEVDADVLRCKELVSICGIARPERFLSLLDEQKIKLKESVV